MADIENQEKLRTANYFEKLEDNKVQCKICANECIVPPRMVTRCHSRQNIEGTMCLTTFAVASSIAVDPIEKKPLYHFYPGTSVFSLGGWGCNFKCLHCQNWQISQPKSNSTRGSYFISPEEAVRLTISHKSQGICWTYNEPAIWFEYTLESAKLAKEKALYTAYVTNGFLNAEPLREISPFLDAYRVDFKGFTDEFYREICAVKDWMKIYENTVLAKELGLHVEIITNIIPGYNDSDKMLTDIARFTFKNLGPDTPWHVTRFFPNNEMKHLPPTPLETIDRAVEIGKAEGLHFIYRGNCPGKSETICPQCKTVCVERDWGIKTNYDTEGCCKNCGYDLNIRF